MTKRTLIGFLSIVLWSISTPILAEEKLNERILEVVGYSEVSIPVRKIEIVLGVESGQLFSAELAQAKVAEVSEKLINYLKTQQAEGLQTQSIRLIPQLLHRKDKPPKPAYVAENIIIFRLDSAAVGGVLDQSVRLGATRIDRVRSYVQADHLEKARLEAIELAVVNASNRAQSALKSLSANVKDIVQIIISPEQQSRAQPMMRSLAMDTSPVSAFEAGYHTVSARVKLKIRYSR